MYGAGFSARNAHPLLKFIEEKLIMLNQSLREKTIVQNGGIIEIKSNELTPGTLVDVIVICENQTANILSDTQESGANYQQLDSRPIWEICEEIMAYLPESVLAQLPNDGAENHDYYLYQKEKNYADENCFC